MDELGYGGLSRQKPKSDRERSGQRAKGKERVAVMSPREEHERVLRRSGFFYG